MFADGVLDSESLFRFQNTFRGPLAKDKGYMLKSDIAGTPGSAMRTVLPGGTFFSESLVS
jgi:hypothetical protein